MSAVSDTDAADDLYIAGRFEVLGSFSESAWYICVPRGVTLTRGSTDIMYARDRRKCCDRDFQSIVMVKTTDIASKKSLDREIEVYKALGDTVGFPNLKSFGEWDDMCFIVMDYKGCNLERLRFNLPAYFDPPTVAMFAIQMVSLFVQICSGLNFVLQIERIKHLHTVGFIHGDIRPDNFTLGPEAPGYTGMRGVARVNLIDFSTASPVEGEWDTRLSRVSNPAFSSIKTLLGHRMCSLSYFKLFFVESFCHFACRPCQT